ncbi:MAG: T9SS C-terminal target domain-containing protein, partial [Calditrichaeota bacterium]
PTVTVSPSTIELAQNYPNPFNPKTRIRYRLAEASLVELTIFNLKGQAVRRLEAGRKGAGTYSVVWDGRDDARREVSSGVYFYQLVVQPLGKNGRRTRASRKLVLVR